MPNSQQYLWYLYLVNNVEDNEVFQLLNLFYFSNVPEARNAQDPINEIEQFLKTETWISNSYLIRQSFNGYRSNHYRWGIA